MLRSSRRGKRAIPMSEITVLTAEEGGVLLAALGEWEQYDDVAARLRRRMASAAEIIIKCGCGEA